jgi:hypothetical protein
MKLPERSYLRSSLRENAPSIREQLAAAVTGVNGARWYSRERSSPRSSRASQSAPASLTRAARSSTGRRCRRSSSRPATRAKGARSPRALTATHEVDVHAEWYRLRARREHERRRRRAAQHARRRARRRDRSGSRLRRADAGRPRDELPHQRRHRDQRGPARTAGRRDHPAPHHRQRVRRPCRPKRATAESTEPLPRPSRRRRSRSRRRRAAPERGGRRDVVRQALPQHERAVRRARLPCTCSARRKISRPRSRNRSSSTASHSVRRPHLTALRSRTARCPTTSSDPASSTASRGRSRWCVSSARSRMSPSTSPST